jgi:hypothetical protein
VESSVRVEAKQTRIRLFRGFSLQRCQNLKVDVPTKLGKAQQFGIKAPVLTRVLP